MLARPVRIFYSYSHQDEAMMQSLRAHLAMLRRRGLITEWLDRDIEAGSEWREEISRELESADLILLFVSADFLNSDFCYEQEMTQAVARSNDGRTRVIGVMLRPVDGWQDSPFAHLQLTPRDAQPVSTWENTDEAFADVASRIRRVVERIRDEHEPASVELSPDLGEAEGGALQEQLTSALGDFMVSRKDRFLVASTDSYYAQFLLEDNEVWCEVVSNDFLDPALKLNEEQEAGLLGLGWRQPEENIPNWWRPAPSGGGPEAIAAFVARTLVEVYGVQPSERLVFETGT